jgi:signal peptidase II
VGNVPRPARGHPRPLFHVITLAAVIFILYFFHQLRGNSAREKVALWGLALVLGGAVGNYIDRVARGFVIDFLEAHWHDRATWPSFNVADAAICVGVGLLILESFLKREPKKAAASREVQGSA